MQISEGVIRLGRNILLDLHKITSKKARYKEHLLHAGTVSKIVETTDPSPNPTKTLISLLLRGGVDG